MMVDDDPVSIDPFIIIEKLLQDPDLLDDERDTIEQVHAHLSRIVTHFNEDDEITAALAAAYQYGIVIGRYVKLRDPETLAEIERLRGKVGGYASGEARQSKWRERAKEYAKKYVSEEKLTRVKLAEKIETSLGRGSPSVDTIVELLKDMVRDGELPRKKRSIKD